MEKSILADWIGISEILPWDRKSYLTHPILPRLSGEGYMHWLYWNSSTLSSIEVNKGAKIRNRYIHIIIIVT